MVVTVCGSRLPRAGNALKRRNQPPAVPPAPAAVRCGPVWQMPPPLAARQQRVVKTCAAAAAAGAVFEATGVPLVDALMKMKTVELAAQHSVRLVGAAFAGVILGSLVFAAIDKLTGSKPGESGRGVNMVAAAVASAAKPAKVLLPFYGVAYSCTVVSALTQVAATKMSTERFAALCRGHHGEVLGAIKFVTQLIQDTSELVLIIFAAWAAIDFKDRVLAWAASWLGAGEGRKNRTFIGQLLRPVSAVLNAVIFIAAAMATLSAYGINVGPLVASIGGIGVAIGLATQKTAANVVSALSLYSGRPFVVGDRVQLLASGRPVVEGVVAQIEPMRTIIIDDSGSPIYMSNSEVTSYMVRNISQQGKTF